MPRVSNLGVCRIEYASNIKPKKLTQHCSTTPVEVTAILSSAIRWAFGDNQPPVVVNHGGCRGYMNQNHICGTIETGCLWLFNMNGDGIVWSSIYLKYTVWTRKMMIMPLDVRALYFQTNALLSFYFLISHSSAIVQQSGNLCIIYSLPFEFKIMASYQG